MVRNMGDFRRFLEAVAFSHAAQLNVAGVARECAVHAKVVAAYIGVLEDLLLAFRLPVFRKRARRATTVHDKLYLFDAGVFRSLRPTGPLDRPSEIDGQALEGLVAQHLRAWAAYSSTRPALHFWRTRGGSEVDFVVYGADGLFGIEVKNAAAVYRQDLRGLRAFREDYPEGETVLLHRGLERLRLDGVWCVPTADFLCALAPNRTPRDALDAVCAG